MKFTVIDPKTNKYPDLDEVSKEGWASGLIGRLDGFAIDEDGDLMLMDRCGEYRCPPVDRFLVEALDTTPIQA